MRDRVSDVFIATFPVKLDAFLKLAGVAATGGQAKRQIEEGGVLVNGVPEHRRGRKLVEGDVVRAADGRSFRLAARPR